jgi:Lon protease-like protein
VFPLGSPVLPTQLLPLHVFEARYRALMEELAGAGPAAEMGVVMIERGSEVGGGDVRSSTGTVTHLIEAERLPDGRWVAIFAGSHPFRVERWLQDDPYPRAMVTERADEPWEDGQAGLLAEAETAVRRALALASELGDAVASPTTVWSAEPAVAAWQLCACAPLGPLDRQALLESPDRAGRLARLAALASDAADLLAFRLQGR